MSGVVHHYTAIEKVINEVDNARIWRGVHFCHSTADADAMDRKIGSYVLAYEAQRK